MLEVNAIVDAELGGLSPEVVTALALQMQRQLKAQQLVIEQHALAIQRKDAELKFKTAKLDKVTFELARLKAWKFGAKSEAMSAEQRRLFEETLTEDEASLLAQLEQLQGQDGQAKAPSDQRRRPKRQALPEQLRRVEHHHEPEDTTCPTPECGRPMVRIGEDISEEQANSAGRVLRAPPRVRQVGLQVLRAPGAGAGAAADHRRWHPGTGAGGGAHADQPLRRSPAVLPARGHQRALGRVHAALDAGAMVGTRRRGAAAAV